MAVRIHVVGARNAAPGSFEAAFAGLNVPAAECANGWCWFQASVWSVETAPLDQCMSSLAGPCIRATSEDGCRWYLRLHTQGAAPWLMCCPFAHLPRAETMASSGAVPAKAQRSRWLVQICPSKPPASDAAARTDAAIAATEKLRRELNETARVLFDQRLYAGSAVPRDAAERLLALPHLEAMRGYFAWLAGNVSDTMTRYGIPHDRERVIATLTGAGVSGAEFDSDLGNMPRFLADIGLGPVFEKWVEDARGVAWKGVRTDG